MPSAQRSSNDQSQDPVDSSSDPGLLTAAEHKAMKLTGELADLIAEIVGDDVSRTNDIVEIYQDIHRIQHAILGQAASRAYPDRYRLLGGPPVQQVRVVAEERPAPAHTYTVYESGGGPGHRIDADWCKKSPDNTEYRFVIEGQDEPVARFTADFVQSIRCVRR